MFAVWHTRAGRSLFLISAGSAQRAAHERAPAIRPTRKEDRSVRRQCIPQQVAGCSETLCEERSVRSRQEARVKVAMLVASLAAATAIPLLPLRSVPAQSVDVEIREVSPRSENQIALQKNVTLRLPDTSSRDGGAG